MTDCKGRMKKTGRMMLTKGLLLALIAAVWMALPVSGAEKAVQPDAYTDIAEHAVFDQGSCEMGYHKLMELWAMYEESDAAGKISFTDYVRTGEWYRKATDHMPITLKALASWRQTNQEEITRLVQLWKAKEAHPRTADDFTADAEAAIRQTAGEMAGRPGMSGRLTIPSVGISVALFDCSVKDRATNQKYTDAQDSAACIRDYSPRTVIADHVFQTFSQLHKSVPASTVAYINDGKTIRRYLYSRGERGINRRTFIYTMDGKPVTGGHAGELLMYTCTVSYIDASDIFYTVWLPLD